MSRRFRWKNDDGSYTTIELGAGGGEALWHGGRIFHLGSAALPYGETVSLDPSVNEDFGHGPRQSAAVREMVDAFRRDSQDAQNVELAAISLEEDFTFERDSDLSKLTMNESAIMSTQRWIISSLPFNVVCQCVRVARMYRQATADFDTPLVSKPVPSTATVFEKLIDATEETRPDIVCLLNELLQLPEYINCHVFSEQDKQIVTAWQGFEFSPNSLLSNNMSPSEMIELAQDSSNTLNVDGVINPQVCYWCRKTALTTKLQRCAQCESVDYCSRICQTRDWRAFHKKECPQLKSGKAKADIPMAGDRNATLRMDGQRRPTIPMEIASAKDSVWRGDLMLLYTIGMSPEVTLTTTTKGFPTGWFIQPREVTKFMQNQRQQPPTKRSSKK